MLRFYPTEAPHDLIAAAMAYEMPRGKFYIQADETIPRSVLPWPFTVETDTFGTPIQIRSNDKLLATILPRSGREKINLAVFPGLNYLKCENGLDAPVHLLVAATHYGTFYYILAKEHYEVAGRLVDQYTSAIASPWNSFFAEWLSPWRTELPDAHTLKLLTIKSTTLTLYNQSGLQGGVTDLVSGLSLTTPAVHDFRNPLLWQPDVYQPYTSSQDITGFGFHIWAPNLCLARWSAFLKYVENAPQFQFTKVSERVVSIRTPGIEYYEQHLFSPDAISCSPLGLLTAIGCMDTILLSGTMKLTGRPAFCTWQEPADLLILYPGVGGGYFDLSVPWDSGVTFDTVYDLDPLTDGWSGTNLAKHFDFGSCPDVYSQEAIRPENLQCCELGPDTKLLTTMRSDAVFAAGVLPVHPLFGGGDPGVLLNPYFAIL
jgi:hypothetical protein